MTRLRCLAWLEDDWESFQWIDTLAGTCTGLKTLSFSFEQFEHSVPDAALGLLIALPRLESLTASMPCNEQTLADLAQITRLTSLKFYDDS